MNDPIKRLADLHASLQAKHGLDWPLTSRGQDPLFFLARRRLIGAEAYLLAGQKDAAALSMQVTEDCLRLLTSMHALATADL